jgi:Zn-dependent M32 family carboxypeptidase
MRVISKEVEVSEFYKILVFKTQEEALRARINTLQNELLDLEDQTGQIAARGGDVTKILSLLRKSRELLDVADTYLLEDSTVDAIKTISETEGVIEEIKYRLEIAKPDFLPTVTLPQVPVNWYIILIFIAIIILVAVIALKKFNLFRDKERRTSLLKIKNTLTKSREANEYSDVYDAIKDQYEEGMISRETFEELKELIK